MVWSWRGWGGGGAGTSIWFDNWTNQFLPELRNTFVAGGGGGGYTGGVGGKGQTAISTSLPHSISSEGGTSYIHTSNTNKETLSLNDDNDGSVMIQY